MSEFLAQQNIVPRPYRSDHQNITPWLDEQIWGHRIWDSQTPWLLFLEFLTVAEGCLRENKLFDERGVYYPLQFRPYRRLYLRNILFNNESVFRIDKTYSDSRRAWKEWFEQIEKAAQGVPNRNFTYLQDIFPTFHDFAALIAILRNTAVESNTNRRWSSRFIFPFGSYALYEDLNLKSGRPSREYINFGRTGELLYLMLCRSRYNEDLRSPIEDALKGKSRLNNLIRLLQPNEKEDLQLKGHSYLPYIRHPSFNLLGEDWNNIFNMGLPAFDAFQHLVLLGAFHMMLYQLWTAVWFCSYGKKVRFVCEAIAPKKTLVRELSIINYQENNVLTASAVENYVSKITQSDSWNLAIEESDSEIDAFARCKGILRDEVWWSDDYDGPSNVDSLIAELRNNVLKGHRQHAGNVHRVYGRLVGLVSKRGTNRLRYAPNDALLKSLIIANVSNRMELKNFLAKLFQKYGLIFGQQEAEQALPSESFDQKAFQANTQRLERRLSSMGMLHRLSDACAYVINPLAREK